VELVLRVLQALLGVGGAARRLHDALRLRDRAAGDVGDGGDPAADDVRARHVDGLGLAAELLDAPLELARVALRLLEVLLQALLVRRRLSELDVQGERGLELLLLAVCLVEPLDQLRVTGVEICH